MTRRYACSVLAQKLVGYEVTNNHSVFLVDATSPYEATGKGMAIALKAYPVAQNWARHNVVVCPDTNVLDPEGTVSRTDPS